MIDKYETLEAIQGFLKRFDAIVGEADIRSNCANALPRFQRAESNLIQFLTDHGLHDEASIIRDNSKRVRQTPRIFDFIKESVELYRGKLYALGEDIMDPLYTPREAARPAILQPSLSTGGSETQIMRPEITASLEKFRRKYPDPKKVCFIMMRFDKTDAHMAAVSAIRAALKPHGITALRADDHEFHEETFSNILTYIYGCGFGVAVFERILDETYNANISLEVGYMLGLHKNVLLLMDDTMRKLQSDLVSRLYKVFDTRKPEDTIPEKVNKWMEDWGGG